MTDDEGAIEAIIQRQFGSLNWSATERARWSTSLPISSRCGAVSCCTSAREAHA